PRSPWSAPGTQLRPACSHDVRDCRGPRAVGGDHGRRPRAPARGRPRPACRGRRGPSAGLWHLPQAHPQWLPQPQLGADAPGAEARIPGPQRRLQLVPRHQPPAGRRTGRDRHEPALHRRPAVMADRQRPLGGGRARRARPRPQQLHAAQAAVARAEHLRDLLPPAAAAGDVRWHRTGAAELPVAGLHRVRPAQRRHHQPRICVADVGGAVHLRNPADHPGRAWRVPGPLEDRGLLQAGLYRGVAHHAAQRSAGRRGVSLPVPRASGEFLRFVLTRAACTAASYGLYLLLLLWTSYQQAYAITFVAGIALAYVVNATLVFREPMRSSSALRFPLVYALQFAAVWLVLRLAVEGFAVP